MKKKKKKKTDIYKAKESLEAHNMHFTHPLLINTTHFCFISFYVSSLESDSSL